MRVGMNSRMDTIQAAVLLQKLTHLRRRDRRPATRSPPATPRAWPTWCRAPPVIAGGVSVWAQYIIETDDRDGLAAHLKTQGVPTAVYYPGAAAQAGALRPLSRSPAACRSPRRRPEKVLALPMHAYLTEADQDHVIAAIRNRVKRNG